MPAVKQQKARKEYKCELGCIIQKGEQYYRIAQRWRPVRIRCLKHRPRPSELTTSDKLSRIYGAQEDLQDALKEPTLSSAWLQDLAEAVESAMSAAEEVRDEYEDSASNMEEYFPDSEQVEEIREKSENCDEWYNELDNVKSDVEDLVERVQEFEAKEKPSEEQKEAYEEWKSEKEDLEGDLDNVVNDVESACDSLSI